jgi:hypothetical protein
MLAFGAVAGGACNKKAGDGGQCTAGEDGCACYGNMTCNPGLMCDGQMCRPIGGGNGSGGSSGTGSGGSTTPGGSGGSVVPGGTGGAPATCSNGTNLGTLPIDATGWVARECNNRGIQGAWYCYDDNVNATSCVDDRTPFRASPPGMCLSGTTTVDATFTAWGAGLGLGLNQTAGSTAKAAYNATGTGLSGLRVTITGNLGGNPLRVTFTSRADTSGTVSPFVELTAAGTHDVMIAAARVPPTWTAPEAGQYANPASIFDVQFAIPGGGRASSYDFCVTSLALIGSGGGGTGGAPGTGGRPAGTGGAPGTGGSGVPVTPATVLVTENAYIEDFEIDATNLYYVTDDGGFTVGSIKRIPKAGGAAVTTLVPPGDPIRDMTVAQDYLAYNKRPPLSPSNTGYAGQIMTVNKLTGGTPVMLHQAAHANSGVGSADVNVYWISGPNADDLSFWGAGVLRISPPAMLGAASYVKNFIVRPKPNLYAEIISSWATQYQGSISVRDQMTGMTVDIDSFGGFNMPVPVNHLIAADNDYVYWNLDTVVYRGPRAAGQRQAIGMLAEPPNVLTRSLQIDDQNLYYVSYVSSTEQYSILRMPKTGGTPVVFATGVSREIRLDATHVYWTRGMSGPPVQFQIVRSPK